MIIREHSDGGAAVFLTPGEYETIVDCAPDQDTRWGVRLGGHSLRTAEVVRARVGDIVHDEETGDYYLRVRDCKKSNYRAGDPVPETPLPDSEYGYRLTRLSRDLGEKLTDAFADADDATRLVDMSKSTYERRIKETRSNAEQRTGKSDYEYVTNHDFRRYYATNLLLRHDVDDVFVLKWGGWSSMESVIDYIEIPPDIAKRHLEEKGLYGKQMDLSGGTNYEDRHERLKAYIDEHFEGVSKVPRRDVDDILETIEEQTGYGTSIVSPQDRTDDDSDENGEGTVGLNNFGDAVSIVPNPLTPAAYVTSMRLKAEYTAVTDDTENWGWGSPAQTAKGAAGLVTMLTATGVIMAAMGVGINPIAGEIYGSGFDAAALTLGSTISAGQLLWADYRARIEDIEFREWVQRHLS